MSVGVRLGVTANVAVGAGVWVVVGDGVAVSAGVTEASTNVAVAASNEGDGVAAGLFVHAENSKIITGIQKYIRFIVTSHIDKIFNAVNYSTEQAAFLDSRLLVKMRRNPDAAWDFFPVRT